ncbi:hypothetical protein EVAR_4170_1 [Eumeta japonica]|uniref:Uncharacterized protein n=1 Tax=Eumeta variegata TaxID=151549 RepID=A0A4C1TFX2_EUMVA|nr:hypothetical protein EVAR_4170_1 [Eumeta japonica]
MFREAAAMLTNAFPAPAHTPPHGSSPPAAFTVTCTYTSFEDFPIQRTFLEPSTGNTHHFRCCADWDTPVVEKSKWTPARASARSAAGGR